MATFSRSHGLVFSLFETPSVFVWVLKRAKQRLLSCIVGHVVITHKLTCRRRNVTRLLILRSLREIWLTARFLGRLHQLILIYLWDALKARLGSTSTEVKALDSYLLSSFGRFCDIVRSLKSAQMYFQIYIFPRCLRCFWMFLDWTCFLTWLSLQQST